MSAKPNGDQINTARRRDVPKAEIRDFSITSPIYRRKAASRRSCHWLAEGART
jgi:hypothetical protein